MRHRLKDMSSDRNEVGHLLVESESSNCRKHNECNIILRNRYDGFPTSASMLCMREIIVNRMVAVLASEMFISSRGRTYVVSSELSSPRSSCRGEYLSETVGAIMQSKCGERILVYEKTNNYSRRTGTSAHSIYSFRGLLATFLLTRTRRRALKPLVL